jgi:hypothetical protein
MLTRARAAVLALAGLTLAACGNIHPGAAAVVDDQTISMKTFNQAAKAYCELTLLTSQQQGATPPENAEVRRQTVTTLVSLVVARKLAEEQGVTPKPSAYELTGDQEDQIAEAFAKREDLDQINRLIEQSQELSAIAVALGEKSTGQALTAENEAQLGAAGQAEITKAFKDNDVEFAPRFGLSNSTAKTVADTGSLSVAPADLGADKPDQLPAAQRCT